MERYMESKENQQKHSIIVENKTFAKITAVAEVISVTEKSAFVKLADGNLQIYGANIKIEKLSPEEKLLTLVGEFSKFEYTNLAGGKGFFKKIFK